MFWRLHGIISLYKNQYGRDHGSATQTAGARISRERQSRKNIGHSHQAAGESARSCIGVFAGVAAACEEIVKDPANAFRYTSRGNLVAVITNGTAVLGLGNIGPLAAKPVMEGKGVLFKKFAGIDVFDLEVNETNLDRLVDIVAALEPTFGGVNLEDIKRRIVFMSSASCASG